MASPLTGISLTMATDQPSVQFYSGNCELWPSAMWLVTASKALTRLVSPLTMEVNTIALPSLPSHVFCRPTAVLDGTLPRKASQCYGGLQPGPQCAYMHWGCAVLEAQHYPDSVHHANFPSVELRAGQTYGWHTRYTFTSV